MRITKPVLFSLGLSLLAASGSTSAPGLWTTPGTPEPSGPIDAGASLVRILDEGGRARAVVRIDVISVMADSEVTLWALGRDGLVEESDLASRADVPRRLVARAQLAKGRRHTQIVEAGLERGRVNHLLFDVKAMGGGVTSAATPIYLRVPLDDPSEPEVVDDYIQYMGRTLEEPAEVEP